MSENNLVAIFAQSHLGGLYIGVEEKLEADPYGEDPNIMPTTFFKLPDDIGETELLDALEQAQETGEIDPKYKVHMVYNGHSGGLSYLMKRDKNGVQYHPGRGLVAIRQRWAKQMGLPKPRMTEAELDHRKQVDYEQYLEDKARGGPASKFGGSGG